MLRRVAVVLTLWVGVCGPVIAQEKEADTSFEAADALYAGYELSAGGRALYDQLFAKGWPTDPVHRQALSVLAGGTSELMLSSYLASEAGLSLAASDYQNARKERRERAGEGVRSTAALLGRDLSHYRELCGYRGSVRNLKPVFLPVRRTKAQLRASWDEEDLASWPWQAPKDTVHTLDGLGFALLAEVSFAADQLRHVRLVEQKGRTVELYGRTPRDGFFALVALHAAAAKVWELRHKLILQMEKREIVSRSSLRGLDVREFAFPWAWTAETSGDTATYALADVDNKHKSRLGAQSAVLLGAAELAWLTGPKGPARIKQLMSSEGMHLPTLHQVALEVCLFAFQSMSKLHVSVRGSGRAASLADQFDRGGTVSPRDLGLFLMALDALINRVHLGTVSRGDTLAEELKREQGRAHTLLGSLSGMIRTWQQNQLGFYDIYSVSTSARQSRTKSLASQAFAIRGLLATHRSVGGGADSPFLKDAKTAVRWLDANLWDRKRKAYLEDDGKGGKRAPLLGAAAVLGALRDLALTTGDGRYLSRYRQYVGSLNKLGFIRQAAARNAPGLAAEVRIK